MTSERDFDRLARAWLELGPDEAPDRVVAAVLQAAGTTPQVRRRLARPTWRSFSMNRLPVAAGAAAVLTVLIGGASLLSRPSQPTGVGVSPTPSATAVASTSTAPSTALTTSVPSELQSTWVGPPRTVPGLLASHRYRFELTEDGFRFPYDNLVQGQLPADAAVVGGRVVQLTSTGAAGGCNVGDVGEYTWTLSGSGTRLTMTLVADACAVRSSALSGDWAKVGCKYIESACFGDLVDAGTYPSQYFAPRLAPEESWIPQWAALTYTVPAGWANSADLPNSFVLTPSDAYAKEGADGPLDGSARNISAYRLPHAVTQDTACVGAAVAGSPTSIDGLVTYVSGLKSVAASAPESTTIDGHPAKWIDATIAPTWAKTCPDQVDGSPVALLLGNGSSGEDENVIGIVGAEKVRLVFIDVGGQVALVVVDSSDPARFDDLATQAMPIIQSFKFQ
ncbi:MAG: hypothetical protein ACJ778_00925 [Chloroflexota bacterium]